MADIELLLEMARERAAKKLADMRDKRKRAIDKILLDYHGRDVSINIETYMWNEEKGCHETYWALKQPSGDEMTVREKVLWFLGMRERREKAPQVWCNL